MRRRAFLSLGTLALVSTAPGALGQAPRRIYRIGLLSSSGEASMVGFVRALWAGLREHGYVEGQNMTLEPRYAAGEASRLPLLARELVATKPDLIVAPAEGAAHEVRKLDKNLPVVLVLGSDPLGGGLAASLGRPGGSVTGLSVIGSQLTAKRLELLTEALPGRRRVAVLYRGGVMYAESQLEALRAPAKAMAVQLVPVDVRSEEALPSAIDAISRSADALLVLPSFFVFTHRKRIVELVREKGVPAMYSESVFVTEGGLMTYSADFHDQFRRAAGYVHRILKGAKPGELPIEEPTKFEFAVNLRTARELQLKLPAAVLVRADRVIE